MAKFKIESPLPSPPAYTQHRVILSGNEGSPDRSAKPPDFVVPHTQPPCNPLARSSQPRH